MKKRFTILTVITLLYTLTVRAQYDATFSHYWMMEPSFNPAAVGKQQKVNVNIAYANGFTGFENNPRTMYAGGDLPFYAIGAYHGIGAHFLNDQIGLFSHNRVAIQYAFKHKLLGGMISIGIQAAALSETFDGTEIDLEDSSDPVFSTTEISGSGFDLAAGLMYTQRLWWIGASAQHITAPLIELGETNELQIDRTYYLSGGCNIRLNYPFLTIHPSVLVRTDLVGWRTDMTARVKYTNEKKVMYAGMAYSPKNSVTVLFGGMFHGISLGYSYEMYTGTISVGNGTHELCVGYQTDLELYKKGRNKHKSVRFL